jgi:hypothetical protein
MHLELNDDVAKLASYMQSQFEAASLVLIAKSISALAPALWGRYDNGTAMEPIVTLTSPVEAAPTASNQ